MGKYPVGTKSTDKDYARSQGNFPKHEMPLEDGGQKCEEEPVPAAGSRVEEQGRSRQDCKNSLKRAENEVQGRGSLCSLGVGSGVHRDNYKIPHQVKCAGGPHGIMENTGTSETLR